MARALLLILGSVIGTLFLATFGGSRDDRRSPVDESENWHRTTAEVLGMLRTQDRMFLLVRYRVGNSLIENDVECPLGGARPRAGQRVSIRYDPMSPARAVLDAGRPSDAPLA